VVSEIFVIGHSGVITGQRSLIPAGAKIDIVHWGERRHDRRSVFYKLKSDSPQPEIRSKYSESDRAFMTVQHARRRERERDWQWALRFFVLAIVSWLYRVHCIALHCIALSCAAQHATTGDLALGKDFRGLFDPIQNFAFFLPYLIALEIYFGSRQQLAASI